MNDFVLIISLVTNLLLVFNLLDYKLKYKSTKKEVGNLKDTVNRYIDEKEI